MKKILFFVLLAAVLMCCSCENDVHAKCDQESVNRYAYAVMKEWYLWYEHLPQVDVAEYDSLYSLINALKYRDGDTLIDRFSYAVKKEEHDDYYAGKRYGMGLSWQRDEDNKLFIYLVYPDSPAGKAGLRRGQQVLALNDITVEELDENDAYNKGHRGEEGFEAKTDWNNVYNAENKGEAVKISVLDEGNEVETVLYLDDYTMKSVLAAEVIDNGGVKTGYIHFKAFISPSPAELDEAFAQFKEAGIEELVLDMRYNGGGLVSVAEYLVDLIGGNKVKGEDIIKIIYNSKHSDHNEAYKGQVLGHSLENVKKVAVIATGGTASASEMVINSLRPFVEVAIIGDTTYGKPVGMNAFDICDQTVVPITFKYANAEDYGDFYLGMPVDCAAEDDYKHDFGDVREESVKEALFWLSNGSCSEKAANRRSVQYSMPFEARFPNELKGMSRIDYTF